MPLSKKRNRERMKTARATCVQPELGQRIAEDVLLYYGLVQPKLQPWEVTDWANYKGEVVPLPNCPDGRYRDV